nr:uncharacterized protein LOC127347043 [Lolium perenne]
MPAFTVTLLAEICRRRLSVEPLSRRLLHHSRPVVAHARRPLLPGRSPSVVGAMLDAIFSQPCVPAVMHLREVEVSRTVNLSKICSDPTRLEFFSTHEPNKISFAKAASGYGLLFPCGIRISSQCMCCFLSLLQARFRSSFVAPLQQRCSALLLPG